MGNCKLLAYCLLTLALLEARILFVNHIKFAFAANDLAIGTAFLNWCSYFHIFNFELWLPGLGTRPQLMILSLFISEYDPSPRQIIRRDFNPYFVTRQNHDVVHPHFSRDGSQYFVAIFQFYPEHCVWKGFQNDTILFNKGLFRHTNFRAAKIGVYGRKKKKPRFFLGLNS